MSSPSHGFPTSLGDSPDGTDPASSIDFKRLVHLRDPRGILSLYGGLTGPGATGSRENLRLDLASKLFSALRATTIPAGSRWNTLRDKIGVLVDRIDPQCGGALFSGIETDAHTFVRFPRPLESRVYVGTRPQILPMMCAATLLRSDEADARRRTALEGPQLRAAIASFRAVGGFDSTMKAMITGRARMLCVSWDDDVNLGLARCESLQQMVEVAIDTNIPVVPLTGEAARELSRVEGIAAFLNDESAGRSVTAADIARP